MKYHVYILYSVQHDKYYVGQTNDLRDRIVRHNSGYVSSTKYYIPWDLVWNAEKPNRAEALLLEKKIKNLSKARIKEFIMKYS